MCILNISIVLDKRLAIKYISSAENIWNIP